MKRRASWGLAVVGFLVVASAPLRAHEVRPASLELTEVASGQVRVVFKQPARGTRGLPLVPRLPAHCSAVAQGVESLGGRAVVSRYAADCGASGLGAGTLTVEGLTATLTDVAVAIQFEDGERIRTLLRPEAPVLDLSTPAALGAGQYFRLGVEHLVFGLDHVFFLGMLLCFVGGLGSLVRTVTAFTLAHSVTLALSVLGWVRIPQAPVESVIALSLVLLAAEAIRSTADQASVESSMHRRPWAVAFGFGLLHGFGFAGALGEIGLPAEDLAPALLLFNLGIEAGQLALIAPAWLLIWSTQRLSEGRARSLSRIGGRAFQYGVGCLGAYWMFDRILPG